MSTTSKLYHISCEDDGLFESIKNQSKIRYHKKNYQKHQDYLLYDSVPLTFRNFHQSSLHNKLHSFYLRYQQVSTFYHTKIYGVAPSSANQFTNSLLFLNYTNVIPEENVEK